MVEVDIVELVEHRRTAEADRPDSVAEHRAVVEESTLR
jgi:hypothetical protein